MTSDFSAIRFWEMLSKRARKAGLTLKCGSDSVSIYKASVFISEIDTLQNLESILDVAEATVGITS